MFVLISSCSIFELTSGYFICLNYCLDMFDMRDGLILQLLAYQLYLMFVLTAAHNVGYVVDAVIY